MDVLVTCRECGNGVVVRGEDRDGNAHCVPAYVVMTSEAASVWPDSRFVKADLRSFEPWCLVCEDVPEVRTVVDDHCEVTVN